MDRSTSFGNHIQWPTKTFPRPKALFRLPLRLPETFEGQSRGLWVGGGCGGGDGGVKGNVGGGWGIWGVGVQVHNRQNPD